ncbi:MAG: hypothetical protein HZB79_03425 [Deltaproteobacteria bacterium]|nr:hypothetical protein [Deltaproteobacteria bacterium]
MKIDNIFPQQIYAQYSNPSTSQISQKNEAGDKNGQKQINNISEQQIQQKVQQLKITEQKVIAHEAAHKSAAGQYAGAISYEYKRGPDGNMYISGGEVPIDTSEEKTSEQTIQKMEQVNRAALAPADPSPQDIKIAAEAAAKAQAAKKEKQEEDVDLGDGFKNINTSIYTEKEKQKTDDVSGKGFKNSISIYA